MKFLIGDEKVFYDFVNKINDDDKIAVLSHHDLDGMASVIFLQKILESKGLKLAFIDFLDYKKGMFDSYFDRFKKSKITKVFLTDVAADDSDFEGFEKLRDSFDTLMIDHHIINKNLKDKKNIIKNQQRDCTAWVLYNFGKKYYDVEKWDWLVCATMVAEFSYLDRDNAHFLKERYSDIDEEKIIESEPGVLAMKIEFNLKYYGGNLFVVYDMLLKKELKELDRIYEIVNKEFLDSVKKYRKEAEYLQVKKIYLASFSPKYNLANAVVTRISQEQKDKIFVIVSERENGKVKVSARNQDGKGNVDALLKKGIQGLENASAGGHIYAAGASFDKKDLKKFKENILK